MARTMARSDIDYVYLEMEHGPMDFQGLHHFAVGMIVSAIMSLQMAIRCPEMERESIRAHARMPTLLLRTPPPLLIQRS